MERKNGIQEIAVAGTCIQCGSPYPTTVALFYGNETDSTRNIMPYTNFQHMGPSLGTAIFGKNDYSRPNVTFADIDGDGDAEIVVVAPKRDDGQDMRFEAWSLVNRKSPGASNNFNKVDGVQYWLPGGRYHWDNNVSPRVATADVNGDGKAEVWAWMREGDNTAALVLAALGPSQSPWGTQLPWATYRTGGPTSIASGDVDADGRDDLALCERRDSSGDNDCAVVGVPSGNASGSTAVNYKKGWQPAQGSSKLTPAMAVGDFDGDSFKIQYTGTCWTENSNPRPLVAMAEVPVNKTLSAQAYQYGDNAYTSYGTSQTTTASQSNSVTESDSITLSLEEESLFDIVDVSVSASFSREFTKTSTTSNSVTMGTQYLVYWDDTKPANSVLYLVTPYTSYQYQILAGPDPSVYESGNNKMTIDVPSEPTQRLDTQEDYNTAVQTSNATNKADLTIGSETFVHTLGVPTTYRTPTACDNLIAAGSGYSGWRGPFEPIPGEASANFTSQISMSQETTTETERTQGVEMTAGVAICGVGFAASQGYSSANVYSTEVGTESQYEGSVAGISSSDPNFNSDRYSVGLVVYNFNRSSDVKYTVIDYCVSQP